MTDENTKIETQKEKKDKTRGVNKREKMEQRVVQRKK